MSDNPDRFRLFHGATGSGRPSCDYPAPHSVQETASTSTPSEDFDDFFDWDAWARDEVTDVTTQSDVPSEGKPAARPSPLTPAGPGVVLPSHQDDTPMPDAPSQEPQLPHVWPSVSVTQPPRDLHIRLEASPPPTASPPLGQKKTRVLKHPEETSLVREMKACYHCKINKTKVLSTVLMDAIVDCGQARWKWNDPDFSTPGRNQFVDGRLRLFIFFDSVSSPFLEVVVGPFALPNQKDHGPQNSRPLGILPDETPSEAQLYQWAEQQIEAEIGGNFEAEMDKLLLKFVRRMQTNTWLDGQQLSIPDTLLPNLLKMRCMWKVWSCKQLFLRQQLGSPAYQFGLNMSSIQDSLRLQAARIISELERKVVDDIEKTFLLKNKKDAARPSPEMRRTVEVTRWLLLWQVILIYRQSLSLVMEQQQTNAEPLPVAG
ncbi:uncharacterized protein THITE_122731 [Thermothielavioides terrestris NRRL 8126]|uniref:Uncharacterized protein n=1 Tax=Thermothielavioides terrestris (strain ATCC 38088 / NRRL 8126) TaxID=578455 RepID=G2RFI2_THETT|nr:uncharacterized protein THITE_122731 [Thermothielavioides terrestris NRRL 8126]AEO70465.1 hypothetical protein THITE_122731 [Thermothielavioides terrestris NRRL 8126]